MIEKLATEKIDTVIWHFICIESTLKVGKCKEFTFGGCEGNGNR